MPLICLLFFLQLAITVTCEQFAFFLLQYKGKTKHNLTRRVAVKSISLDAKT